MSKYWPISIAGLYLLSNSPKRAEEIDPDKPFITPELRNFIWKRRWEKMVKIAKETSSSVWAAPILLSLLLMYSVYNQQATNNQLAEFKKEAAAQHDLLIELKTLNQVAKENEAQKKIDEKLEADLDRVFRERMNEKMQTLTLIVQGKYPNNIKDDENN